MRQPLSNLLLLLASAGARALAGAGNACRWLMPDQANNYRPEAHYMRGPGPKWHAKNAPISTRR
jgi:hypothetical protein